MNKVTHLTKQLSLIFLGIVLTHGCGQTKEDTKAENNQVTKTNDDRFGNEYRYVTNDPYDARIYELDNGLKVYLTVDEEKPRIQTLIAVRAGSAFEQKETTGLAHYMEHMMFKGGSKLGTTNWEKEKKYLKRIANLYEKRKNTTDSAKRLAIYRKIDSLSQIAGNQYAIPNEYDKMISDMGGDGTNAFTSKDQTVYMNNIPSNEIEKWVRLERERFGSMALRLFHTELETVFEEFNRSQDSDYRKVSELIDKILFKGHPYRYSTIGKAADLKNPSMKNVREFKDSFYVPNNMAICLSGDMDPAETFKLIKEHWGDMEPNQDLKDKYDHGEAKSIDGPIEKSVTGPEAERLYIAYRFSAKDSSRQMVELLDELLYNGQAGLIDLNLVKKQKILDGGCYSNFYRDYGKMRFYGQARPKQNLEEVKDLLLEQVARIKKGDFPDWMMEAAIRNKKKERIEDRSSNWKAFAFTNAFIKGNPWEEQVNYLQELDAIEKEDLVKFAKENLDEDRVVVYKRNGEDTSSVSMPKPPITKLDINRKAKAGFGKKIEKVESERIEPVFPNYDKRIRKTNLDKGVDLHYMENRENELFSLYYLADIGSLHDKELSLAVDYLEKLGTDQYSPTELEEEFYKLGADYSVSTGNDRSYVKIKGLKENFEETLELLEHILNNAKVDTAAYNKFVDNLIKERKNKKKNKFWNRIAGVRYAMYGPDNAFSNKIPASELRRKNPKKLVRKIHSLFDHSHYLFYYGTRPEKSVKAIVKDVHALPEKPKPFPEKKKFTKRANHGDSVFVINYDMEQAQMSLVSRDIKQDTTLFPYGKVYRQYYGTGLSSILFQEIREAKGYAYSVSSFFTRPDSGKYHANYSYLGTQPDKLENATADLKSLLNEMMASESQFKNAKVNILKNIETDRTTGTGIYFSYLNDREKGFKGNRDRYVYNKVKDMTMEDFKNFFNSHIKDLSYDMVILGDDEKLNNVNLSQFGEVRRLPKSVIFGYSEGSGDQDRATGVAP